MVTGDDGPPNGGTLVQVVAPGRYVSSVVALGTLTAYDPYVDWQPIDDPPPLSRILRGVTDWPPSRTTDGNDPFLTREVGEKLVAEARRER